MKKQKTYINKDKFDYIQDYLKRNGGYEYYSNNKYDSIINDLKKHHKGINCSECTEVEMENRLKGAFVREHITRKATPEELEWIREQEPVTDPDVFEELRPVLEWLCKYAGFGKE